ncbi:MAG: ABC transporter permease [Treponema sp.]|nr:ABC transporter permease [Treponema sp.]
MNFALKRTVTAFITLFLVSLFCFLAFSVIRGDPASLMLGTDATEEQLAAFREEAGLNRSVPVRYIEWLGNFFSGNLGSSLRFQGESISAMILERLPVSFTLALLALVFILLIAVPVSLLSVRHENDPTDHVVNICTAIGISIPNFFLGVLIIWVFGITLRLFSAGMYVDYRTDFSGFIGSLCFPALAIAVPNAAILIKFLRSSIFKELHSDYVRTARSKGAGFSVTLHRHVLRNAVIPSITVLGMIIAEVFSGSIIIEQVFGIPGLGRLLIVAIGSRDYPLIQTLVVIIAFIVVAANTLVDIAIQVVDPRIRLKGNSR